MKDLHADRDFQASLFIIGAAFRKKTSTKDVVRQWGPTGETLLSVSLSNSCLNPKVLNHFSKKKIQVNGLNIFNLFVS